MKEVLKKIKDKMDELTHWKCQLSQAHRRGKSALTKKAAWDALKRSSRGLNTLMLKAEKSGEVNFNAKTKKTQRKR